MQRQLAAHARGGIWRTLRVHIWATLRHFDSKVAPRPKMGPLIPCERRLAKTEFLENQEATFETRFGNRDYGRPFRHI